MAYKKPKITKKEISQKFNLSEIFNRDFKNDPELRDKISNEIIDYMVNRTLSGAEIGNKKDLKKPYSESYANSSEFKAAGKSKNNVNMNLTGKTLESVDVTSKTTNTIKVEITADDRLKAAFNQNTGDTIPKRPWFGLRKYEFKEIKDKYRDELKELPKKRKVGDIIGS